MNNPWSTPEQEAEWTLQQNRLAALEFARKSREPEYAYGNESYPAEEANVLPEPEPERTNPWARGPHSNIQIKATPAPGMPHGRTWSIKQVMD